MINIETIGEVRNSPIFVGLIQGLSLGNNACDVSVAYPADYDGAEKRFSGIKLMYYHSATNNSMGQWCFMPGDLVWVKMKGSSLEPDAVLCPYGGAKIGCVDWGWYGTGVNDFHYDHGPNASIGRDSQFASMTYRFTDTTNNTSTQTASLLGYSQECGAYMYNMYGKYTANRISTFYYEQEKYTTTIKSGKLNQTKDGGTFVITLKVESSLYAYENDIPFTIPQNGSKDPIYYSFVFQDNVYVVYQDGTQNKATPLTFSNKSAYATYPSIQPFTMTRTITSVTESNNTSQIYAFPEPCLSTVYPNPYFKYTISIKEEFSFTTDALTTSFSASCPVIKYVTYTTPAGVPVYLRTSGPCPTFDTTIWAPFVFTTKSVFSHLDHYALLLEKYNIRIGNSSSYYLLPIKPPRFSFVDDEKSPRENSWGWKNSYTQKLRT